MDGNHVVASRGAHRRAVASACGLVAVCATGTGAGAALVARLGTLLPAEPLTVTVDRWVEVAVLVVGVLAAGWLVLSALFALLCVAAARWGRSWQTGEAVLRRVAPAAVQRLARGAVGVGVGAGLALVPAAAHAAPDDGVASPAEPRAAVTVDLGWQPTALAPPEDPGTVDARPPAAERTSTTREPATDHTPRPRRGADPVVVHRGDTLWAIAASTLPDGASDADVLRAVVRWHEANRDVIGDDPDLVLPGQVLRAPA